MKTIKISLLILLITYLLPASSIKTMAHEKVSFPPIESYSLDNIESYAIPPLEIVIPKLNLSEKQIEILNKAGYEIKTALIEINHQHSLLSKMIKKAAVESFETDNFINALSNIKLESQKYAEIYVKNIDQMATQLEIIHKSLSAEERYKLAHIESRY